VAKTAAAANTSIHQLHLKKPLAKSGGFFVSEIFFSSKVARIRRFIQDEAKEKNEFSRKDSQNTQKERVG
jgi:hypothetical protein